MKKMEYSLILTGAIGGIAYSLSGWAKNRKKTKKKKVNYGKLGGAAIIGLIYGVVASVTMQDVSVVANGAMGTAITALVQNAYKAINS
ncbi:hypothetical protein GF389_05910 [Candidatus Dojkabacteria bacterium]|nr:hypothetical protein [Candidatus Dojkabacteria bacterium]